MLETKELTIRFGGHVAVDRVSCAFAPGTLTAIVGPNGAGKTTYFNLISGQLRASAGSVWFDGVDITGESVPARSHRGLGRAFQLTQLFPNLSVVENVRLAVQSRRKEGLDLLSVWLDRKETLEREFERLPYEPLYEDVLGMPVRKVVIAVDAGRNLAVLVEAAVRNTILQLRGIDTYREFVERHQRAIEQGLNDTN